MAVSAAVVKEEEKPFMLALTELAPAAGSLAA
jgi:hypothetical protein